MLEFGLLALQRRGGPALPPGFETPGDRFTLVFSKCGHISPCLSLHSSALQTCGPGDEEHTSPSRESHWGAWHLPPREARVLHSSSDPLRRPLHWVSCLEVNAGLLPVSNLCPAILLPTPLLRMQDLPRGGWGTEVPPDREGLSYPTWAGVCKWKCGIAAKCVSVCKRRFHGKWAGQGSWCYLPPRSVGHRGRPTTRGFSVLRKQNRSSPCQGKPVNSIHADKAYPNILFPPTKEPPLRACV